MGSDHEVFEAAGFRIPMVYFHDYPDVTIHTQKDLPENLDATKLGRVAYIGAGIGLDARGASRLRGEGPARRDARRGRAARAGARLGARAPIPPSPPARRSCRASRPSSPLARLCPSIAPDVARDVEHLQAAMPPPPPTTDRRVPIRAPGIVGPLNVYYYDYFAEVPGADPAKGGTLFPPAEGALAKREDGEVLVFEALNLADGKRTVSDIRDALVRTLRAGAAPGGRRVLRASGDGRAPSPSGEDRPDRVHPLPRFLRAPTEGPRSRSTC